MKIAILIHSMKNSGGTERVAANLSGMLARNGIETELVIISSCKESFYTIDDAVQVINLNVERLNKTPNKVLSGKYSLNVISSIRKHMQTNNPDFVLAIWTDISVYATIARFGLKTKVIACEHITHEARGIFWQILRKHIYKFTDAIVALTKRDADVYRKINTRSYAIPNAVSCDMHLDIVKTDTVLAVGSVSYRKGFDLLIKAWAIVYKSFPKWKLKIIGSLQDTSYVEALRADVEQLNLTNSVQILPAIKDIEKEYKKASIFVLPSRQEGLPMVLLEAMCCGLPAVAFDCPTGPKEIIKHNETGILVEAENVVELASALVILMTDLKKRDEYACLAKSDIEDRFGEAAVLEMWKKIFDDLT